MRILDAIFLNAHSAPNRPAMALADRIVTYDMLARGTLSVETRAKMSGVRQGDVVVVALTSPIRHMIVTLALMRLGAVSVSVDEADSPAAKQLDPDWTLVDDFEDIEDKTRAHLVTDEWFYGFDGSLSEATAAHVFDDDEVCRIVLSSGTTGLPKPLAFSPRIISDRIFTRIALNADCTAERTLMAAPIATQMGWTGALASLAVGGLILFAINPETTLQMIDVYGVTDLVATANQIRDLLSFKENTDFTTNSLRTLQIGGGIVSPMLARKLQTAFCHKIVCRYGSTETGIVAYADAKALESLEGAVGFIAPWAYAEVLNEEGGISPPGVSGSLRVRTASLAQPWSRGMGYCTVSDLWFDTGDFATLHTNGALTVQGRANNVLNIGGVKISCEAIESTIMEDTGVSEAGVFSVVGASGLEEVWAVVAGDDIDKDRILANVNKRFYATPITRLIAFPRLPRTTGGKLLRAELRTQALASSQS